MILFFRSLLFNVFLALWTFAFGICCLPFLLLPVKYTVLISKYWSIVVQWALKWICGITHEVRGQELLPNTPFIIASKHQSAWDTIAFCSLVQQPSYIYKKELHYLPIYGQYLPGLGMIPVDRSGKISALKHMIRAAKKRLLQGATVIIFPEGTRTAIGEKKQYQAGIVALYHECDVPVIPVAVNSGLYWSRNSFIKKPGHITLEFLPAVAPGLNRKDFLNKLTTEIESKTDQLVEHPPVK